LIGIAIIGHPVGNDRIKTGYKLSGQPEIHIIKYVQKLVGSFVKLRPAISNPQNVTGRIFAGHGGGSTSPSDKTQQLGQAYAVHVDETGKLLPQVVGPSHVHP